MILKSFYRKRTTKIYFIILVLIMCAFATIVIGRNKYIDEYNKNYDNSFIYVESAKSLSLDHVEHVSKVEEAIKSGFFYYMLDKNIIDHKEAIIPSFFKKSYPRNSFIEEEDNSFVVKGFYDMPYMMPIVYINEDVFKEISSKKNKKGYILKIDSWIEYDEVVKYITKNTKSEAWGFEINKSNVDYSQLIDNFTLYSYIIIAIFILVIIITLYNVTNDQKEKEYLYRSLGYAKKKIYMIQFVNILSLYVFSMLVSLILIFIVKFIF